MTYLKLLLGLGVLATAGCAHTVPSATTFAYSTQQQMQAAHHWEVLAERVADKLTAEFSASTLHIEKPRRHTPFNRAFHDLLTGKLVQRGIAVSHSRGGSIPVSFDVQVVRHNDRGFLYPFPGFLNAGHDEDGNIIYYHAGGVPDVEVLVTTTASDRGYVAFRETGIFYVNENNVAQYRSTPRPVLTRFVQLTDQ